MQVGSEAYGHRCPLTRRRDFLAGVLGLAAPRARELRGFFDNVEASSNFLREGLG